MGMCACRSPAKLLRYFNKIRDAKTFSVASNTRTNIVARLCAPSIQFNGSLIAYASTGNGQNNKSPSITESILQQKVGKMPKDDNVKDKEPPKGNKDKDKKSSKWTGQNMWKIGLLSLGGMSALSCGILLKEWGAPRLDENGKEIQDEFSHLPIWQQYPKRALREFEFYKQLIKDPTSEKLLPDPLKEPYYQPPYTLVLEMTGVLVHPDWTYGTGWRFKKRPGIEYFLQQVGPPIFEVVIYTAEQGFTAFPILDSLDPHGYITYRLFRDATRYVKGHHVKDLACLNRDLSKLIFVDCNPKSYQLQPKNALGLKKWKGEDDDRTLVDLALFLRTIASSGIEDVRSVLEHYSQFDDPLEAFKENQRKLQEEQEKTMKAQEDLQKQQSLVGSVASGFFRRR
ncbi:mitochondrial import inner membrane translocase subunit TIM50-like [Lineus longissimus]|uniref:mitochondrial import inner membrane translocase subunit TIM50-like n=1 Tax=Lineus longissimus TaxID=88925 RepID=UPI00315CA2B8